MISTAIFVTGGCGFIGSNFIRHILSHDYEYSIVNIDKLTYAGNISNLRDIEGDSRYFFIKGDICNRALLVEIFKRHEIEKVVHFAAESHVDRSISDPSPFTKTNVLGTQTLLDVVLKHDIEQFIHVSTDEVYGSISTGSFKESDRLNPSNPYAASKAASDLLVRAFYITYSLPAIITRCTNNFGPYQYPEKLIPLFVTNILEGKKVPVYGSGRNIRDWIYVIDHCSAIEFLMDKGRPGEIYNIGGGNELTILEITCKILSILNKDESWVEFVEDRPGHDYRYSLDCSKIHAMGWKPRWNFDEALVKTINWYRENEWWWRSAKRKRVNL